MTQIISRTYDNFSDARSVIEELKAIGVPEQDISLLAHEWDDNSDSDIKVTDPDDASAMGTGAGVGGLVGAGAGLLAGLGLMAIPGVGPLVAAGWLATTAAGTAAGAAAGAAAGGLVDVMTSRGVPENDAELYAEAVRRGAVLVSVQANDVDAERIRVVMDRHAPNDLALRRTEWEKEGWTGYDPSAAPYVGASGTDARKRYM